MMFDCLEYFFHLIMDDAFSILFLTLKTKNLANFKKGG